MLPCQHHIITDGWSMGVLTGELAALYTAAVAGRDAALSRCRSSTRTSRSGSASQLTGPPWTSPGLLGSASYPGSARLELPADRPRPPVRTPAGATCQFTIGAPVTGPAQGHRRARDATLFMALAAAVQILLSRWSGQDDIAVGTAAPAATGPS